jgi:hypothetical protein
VAARYTALPILLIEAALIIGVDHALRKRRDSRAPRAVGQRFPVMALRPAIAAVALVAFLIGNWVADFRYFGIRSGAAAHRWAPVAAEWKHDCKVSRTGEIAVSMAGHKYTILCDRLRFLWPAAKNAGKVRTKGGPTRVTPERRRYRFRPWTGMAGTTPMTVRARRWRGGGVQTRVARRAAVTGGMPACKPGSGRFPAPAVVILAGDCFTVTRHTGCTMVRIAAVFAGFVAVPSVG